MSDILSTRPPMAMNASFFDTVEVSTNCVMTSKALPSTCSSTLKDSIQALPSKVTLTGQGLPIAITLGGVYALNTDLKVFLRPARQIGYSLDEH